jgi:tRNA modification GTPase
MKNCLKLAEHEQVIVAACTPPSRAALAVVRVSGVGAIQLVDHCAKLASKKKLADAPSHTINFGELVDQGQVIDQVLFLLTKAPKTFTGQDTVEMTTHGNPMIVEQILRLMIKYGARVAEPGEFTKRAFLNGKIDLVQAEAIQELVMANTELALDQSMRKLKAGLSNKIQELETLTLDLISALEASFEFLEEEERDAGFEELITARLKLIRQKCALLQQSCQDQTKVSNGIKIAILGTPNAGKSSLFNSLVGHARAIVSDQAGTTRDSIEALVFREGQLWSLVDTAGIRNTDDLVELEGIQRALQEAALADVIILLFDPSVDLTAQLELATELEKSFAHKVIKVCSKSDLKKAAANSCHIDIAVSAKTGQGVAGLQALVAQKIQQLFAQHANNFALTRRQRLALEQFFHALTEFEQNFAQGAPNELLTLDLRTALRQLSNLTGRNVQEKVLEQVFSNFCVGK